MYESSYHTSLLNRMRYVLYGRARALVAGGGLFGVEGGRSCVLKVTASTATTTLQGTTPVSRALHVKRAWHGVCDRRGGVMGAAEAILR